MAACSWLLILAMGDKAHHPSSCDISKLTRCYTKQFLTAWQKRSYFLRFEAPEILLTIATPKRASDNPERRTSPVLLSSACSLYFCEQLLLHSVKQTGSKVARVEQNLVLEGNLGDRERQWVTQNYNKKIGIPQVASDPPSYLVPLGFTPTQALLVTATCCQWLPRHPDIPLHLQLSLHSSIQHRKMDVAYRVAVQATHKVTCSELLSKSQAPVECCH